MTPSCHHAQRTFTTPEVKEIECKWCKFLTARLSLDLV